MDTSMSEILLWSTKHINNENLLLESSSLSRKPLQRCNVGQTPIKEIRNESEQKGTPLTQDGYNWNSNDSCFSKTAPSSPSVNIYKGKLNDETTNHKENVNCLMERNSMDENQMISKTPPSILTKALTKNNPLHWSRIERDLASPSAAVRMRAIKAINDPQKYAYTPFDVPTEELSLHIPYLEPPSITEVMRNIVVYVEVRSGEDNRSAGVRKVIESLGAKVNATLSKSTTHVVFKDGLLSTYKKAKQMGIPVVSILWIEDCKTQRRICNTEDYPISNIDRYENPELYSKMKRIKSMQPDSEINKRIRNKVNGTPNRKKILNATPTQKTELMKKNSTLLDDTQASSSSRGTPMNISHYFKKLNDKTLMESPATQLLNKIEDEIAITNNKNNLNYNELWSSRASLFTELGNEDLKHYNQLEIQEILKEGDAFSSKKKTLTSNSRDELTEMDVTIDSLKIMSLSNVTPTLRSNEASPTQKLHKNCQNTINTTKTMSLDNDSLSSSRRRETFITQSPSYGVETLINNRQNDTNRESSKSCKSTTYSLREMDESELKENIFVAKSAQSLNNLNTKRGRTLLLRENKNKSPAVTSKSNLIIGNNNTLEIKMKRRTLFSKTSIQESKTDIKTLHKKEEAISERTPRKQTIKNSRLESPRKVWNKINEALQKDKKGGTTECAVANAKNGTTSVRGVPQRTPAKRRTLYSLQNMHLDGDTENLATPTPIRKSFSSAGISTTAAHVTEESLNGSNTALKQQQQQDKSLIISSPIKPGASSQVAVPKNKPDMNIKETTTNSAMALSFIPTRASTNRRRTMFSASMDIIAQRLQCINQTTTNRRSVTHMSLDICSPYNKNNNCNITKKTNDLDGDSIFSHKTSETKNAIKKKRKLFVPGTNNNNNDDIINTTPPQSLQYSKAQTSASASGMQVIANVLRMTPIHQKSDVSPNTRAIRQILHPTKLMPSPLIKTDVNSTKNSYRRRRSTLDFEVMQNKVISDNNSNTDDDKSNSNNDNSGNTDNNSTNHRDINDKDAYAIVEETLPILSYTNMNKNEINVIREAVALLGGFRLNSEVSDESSHLITSYSRRTLNSLRALIRGLWILRYDWIIESVKAGHWVAEEPYELDGFSRAIKICRSERQAFGATYKSELFLNFGPYYVASHCYPISRQTARELITLCGGKLVRVPSRARYIIGEWKSCHQYHGIKLCISSNWILDSITEMQILNVNKYICKPSNILNKIDGSNNIDGTGSGVV